MKESMEDMVSILELDTKPYVVFKQTAPLPKYNDAPFDQCFYLRFLSASFQSDILNNTLLQNQGAIKLDIDNPNKTKLFGKEQLEIEDLIFRKITKGYLKQLNQQYGTILDSESSSTDEDNKSDDDDRAGEEEDDINGGAKGKEQDPKILLTLKQLIDEWPQEEIPEKERD